MGNQNTSGIVEVERGTNEASDNAVAVSPPDDDVKEQEQTLIQEKEADADAQDAECDKIPPVERPISDDNDIEADIEDHKGSVDEGTDAVLDISMNESNVGEGTFKLSDEELEQPCTLQDTSHEAEDTTSDIQEDQNMLVQETLEVDDHDAKKADMVSVEDVLLEARAHEEEVERDDDPPQEEQSNSSNIVNDAPTISLPDLSTADNESENECLALDHEEKPMMHELGNADANNTSCVDQDQPSDHEDNQFLIKGSSDPTDMMESDLTDVAEKHEDNESTDQNMLEKAVHWESEPSATENEHETESETTEKCVVELQSSTEIDTQCLSSKTAEAETQYCSDSESKVRAGVKMLDAEANQSHTGAKVEFRKSPSFDFGLAFDTRSEESDQTPLLYQDRTARRSVSSCSNLRFQNRSIQTELLKKPLQFEAVQVEEKTIRMERSNSDNPNAVMKDTQINGPTASPSRDDEATISPKGNSKRKSRSSLFTICICCTAAIS